MVAIIGRAGRHVPKDEALEHVAGYSIFNEGSVRDFQFKSSQWTMGKNFDATGGFGPELVTADELPEGATGLRLETRLNGEVMQRADTKDMVFGVAELVHVASEAMTLAPGDVIVTGTPGGVGFARDPKIFMKDGDTCEVEIEGIGLLRNPIRDEVLPA
jgi:2-keto-4-pentenoate hydratase/2-oxohepta-3-ene-1,7-dioic acid hydratase in catechol pathway